MSEIVLNVVDLWKSYDDLQVLKGVSFEVKEREVKVIFGPSGSGKSTLLRCINMLNRRKFLKRGILATIGSFFFPNYIYSDSSRDESILEFKPEPANWAEDHINISWIGHSTVLISFFGTKILTDPALLDRVGIYIAGTSFGPSRLTPPALNINEMPKPDIILLSHAHMDHMDYPTLRELTDRYPHQIDAITAYLTQDVIDDLKWKSLKSLDWGEDYILQGIKFTALEVKHFGWRYPWETDRYGTISNSPGCDLRNDRCLHVDRDRQPRTWPVSRLF